MRTEMEARLDMHAVDIYGLSEVMGPGVANECVETKDGLHVWEDHFFPEIIDPVTGEVLPDGEKGELVFTSLTKQAMPVIRYRTRDLTRLLPGTAPADAADREDHRPHRRHDHPARREPLPHPDRGADPAHARPVAALPVRADRSARLDELTVRVERRTGTPAAAATEAGAALGTAEKKKDDGGVRVRGWNPKGTKGGRKRKEGSTNVRPADEAQPAPARPVVPTLAVTRRPVAGCGRGTRR